MATCGELDFPAYFGFVKWVFVKLLSNLLDIAVNRANPATDLHAAANCAHGHIPGALLAMYWHAEYRRHVQKLCQWSGGTIPTTGAHPLRGKPTTHGRSGSPDTHGRNGPAIHGHGGPATHGRNDGTATHWWNGSPATHRRNGSPETQIRSFNGDRNSVIILRETIN